MKHVEFSSNPPRYEILPQVDGSVKVLFYDDVQKVDRQSNENETNTEAYTATCYEMATYPTKGLNERINGNYETWLAKAKTLDGGIAQKKATLIADSKTMLAEYLATHPIHSNAHGTPGVYSVTEEKQTLMVSQYISYQAEKTSNPSAKLTWNETGKSCEEWTEEQFMQLVVEIKHYVYPLVSYQQKIEEQINACTTLNELEAVVIDYDSAIA